MVESSFYRVLVLISTFTILLSTFFLTCISVNQITPPIDSVLPFDTIKTDAPVRVELLCSDSTSTILFSGPNFVFDSVYLGYIYNSQSGKKSDTFFESGVLIMAPYEALEQRLFDAGYNVNVGNVCDTTLPIPGTDSLQVTGQVGMNESVDSNYYLMFHTSYPIPQGLYVQNYNN